MRLDGLFGMTTGVSATIAFSFILFSTVLFELGGGDAFLKLAQGLVGQFRGGPAKIATVASCLFGTISGVSSANVASTGSFTIPMMKKMGYRAHFAAAVESVASTGGQLMPPVMGVAAFVMIEFLEVSYWQLCVYAVFPAVLYYLAVFVMVDLEARRLQLEGIPKDQLPKVFRVLKESWAVVIPAAVLIFMIGYLETSPSRAAFWSTVVTLALYLLQKIQNRERVDWKKIIRAFELGAKRAIMIAAICAAVGIVMGVINMSGLGLKLSSLLIDLSFGKLPLLLFYTMVASMLLGMGLPSLPAYIILAVLAAPSLIEMGINRIAAHLFVYYYGMISSITPPVAIASFVAAGIAGSPAMKTAWTSTRLGIAAYILPFMFVYSPSLLLMGDLHKLIMPLITSCIGIFALGLASEGYFLRKISWVWRILLFCSALLLIYPTLTTDSLGIGIMAVFLVTQKILREPVPKPA
jgi:TRAP transporter 4TM/12TM fusion protein